MEKNVKTKNIGDFSFHIIFLFRQTANLTFFLGVLKNNFQTQLLFSKTKVLLVNTSVSSDICASNSYLAQSVIYFVAQLFEQQKQFVSSHHFEHATKKPIVSLMPTLSTRDLHEVEIHKQHHIPGLVQRSPHDKSAIAEAFTEDGRAEVYVKPEWKSGHLCMNHDDQLNSSLPNFFRSFSCVRFTAQQ